ncbi:MAG: peptidylprolyl isomerase [Gammaproteobacteria bacterium]|nr:peptidylprolyl isomerase [Gammaproteobacteria bacterium]MDH5170841.1 peptidylprolyl isomerase [Gammaproteobacteria bacterium]
MNIKALLAAAGLAVSVVIAPGLRAETQMVDQVVAIVDDDIIMASELRERVAALTETLKSRGMEVPPEDTLIRETLDRLILESIQLQKGARVGVRISDAQLNAAIQNIAAQNRMTLEQFIAALEQQGQSYPEMREQVRREMIIQRVQAGNVNQRIQITPKEVDNFLATEDGKKLTQPEYHLLHALLPIKPGTSPQDEAEARAYVEQLVKRIRSGEPFEEVIRSSREKYNFSGGDIGWRKAEDLPSLFAELAPNMPKGATSDPIRSDSGFHLIYMQDIRGGEQIVAQTKASHILIKTSEILTDDQARELAQSLRARAEAGEDFATLAREYSEDIGSAQEGGELGWTSPGQMVPEFEQAMKATAVGEISAPVRTQFGWHIVKVEDRRDEDMTTEAIRNKAAEFLHNRKYQEELDAWLQQIRDEAFVDIK